MNTGATHTGAVPREDTDARTNRVVHAVDHLAAAARAAVFEAWAFLRFFVFLFYLLLVIVGFWFGLVATGIGVLRMALRAVRVVLLLLSGGHPPPSGGRAPAAAKQELQRLWATRMLLYADIAVPVARDLVAIKTSLRRFWYWGISRKLATIVMALSFVGLPLLFVIPRPHEVQITDDNAISHTDGALRYLIHGLDLDNPTVNREYENEYALFLGKINPQGLKAQLQPGRFYRLWIVGIRWNYFPATMYPNILWATEIDMNRSAVQGAALLGAPPTSAR